MTKEQLYAEQAAYLARIKEGEGQLIPQLWELLRPLTRRYISRYIMQGQGERLYNEEDLWQESYIALIAALDYWQPDKGAFSTVYLWTLQRQTRRMRGRAGSDAIFSAESLDKPQGDESETTRGEFVPDDTAQQGFEAAERGAYLDELRRVLADIDATMNDDQREVIHARYYGGQTLAQIGERLGLSAERCRRIEYAALQTYRKPDNMRRLSQFVRYDSGCSVGAAAFRRCRASSVELTVERLEGLRSLESKVSPERRQRWQREREVAEQYRRWRDDPPDFMRKRWQRYIDGEIDSLDG